MNPKSKMKSPKIRENTRRATAFLVAFVMVAAMTLGGMQTHVFARYDPPNVPAGKIADPTAPAALLNAGFENNTYSPGAGASFQNADADTQNNVSGWLTTEPDGNIELWSNGFHPGTANNANNFGSTTFYAASGTWLAEINANFPSSVSVTVTHSNGVKAIYPADTTTPVGLYQDVTSLPGSLYEWSFDHRGRNGTDAAHILLGDPATAVAGTNGMLPETATQPASSLYYQGYIANYADANITAAVKAAGTYTGPALTDPTVLVAPRNSVNLTASQVNGGGGNRYLLNPNVNATNPDPATGWTMHKGYYTIPVGQATTRFQMESVYSTNAGGGLSQGNLIDNVNFFPIAAPTLQVFYQGDPNATDPSMSVGYQLNPDNTPVLNSKGIPVTLGPDSTTPGFTLVPEFDQGTNVSLGTNAGFNYTGNYGKPYTLAPDPNAPTKYTITAATGLYNIPVKVYSNDPHDIVYLADGVTPDLTKSILNPDGSGTYLAYVGIITSQILVLPSHTISGTVYGTIPGNSDNSGLEINYTYKYQAISPATGLPEFETDANGNPVYLTDSAGVEILDSLNNPIPVPVMVSGTGTTTTLAGGTYSFEVPDVSQVTVSIAPVGGNAFNTAPNKSGAGTALNPALTTDGGNPSTSYAQDSLNTGSFGNDFIYAHTVSGAVSGLADNSGVSVPYSYTYQGTDPITGNAVMLNGSGTVTTDASGNYSFSVPDGATVTVDLPGPVTGYSTVQAVPPATGTNHGTPGANGYTISNVTADSIGNDFVYTCALTNDAPTTPYNTAVDVPVLDNDTVPANSMPANLTGDTNGTWSVNSDGTVHFIPTTGFVGDATATYQVKDSAGNILKDINGEPLYATITVAVGNAPTYTVTYDSNFGTGTGTGSVPTDPNAYKAGDTAVVLGNTGSLTQPGYKFKGWNTLADGTGMSYGPSDQLPITDNVTLYAQWTPVTPNVQISKAADMTQVGSGDIITYRITVTNPDTGSTGPATDVTVSDTAPQYTTITGASYDSAATTSMLTITPSFTSGSAGWTIGTLDAGQTAVLTMTVRVDYPGTTSSFTQNIASVTWTDPANPGTPDGPKDSYPALTSIIAPDVVVTKTVDDTTPMNGDTITYTITATNNGTDTASGVTVSDPLSVSLMYVSTTPTSFTVIPTPDSATNVYTWAVGDLAPGETATITLTAAVNLTAGEVSTGVSITNVATAKWSDPNDPSKESSTASDPVNVTVAPIYTVTYNGNGSTGGTVPTDPTPYNPGDSVPVQGGTNTLTKDGFTFGGWSDGNGRIYQPGDTIPNLGSNVTLTAIWTPNPGPGPAVTTYTVTYNGNGSTGGTVPNDPAVYTIGSNATVRDNTGSLTRPGYTFAGWNTIADGTGTAYAPNASLPPITGDVMLYAQWIPNAYTVTYNANGGTGDDYKVNVSGGDTHIVLTSTATSISRTGYTFKGWNTKADGTGTAYAPDAAIPITGDVTLYAQWSFIGGGNVYNGGANVYTTPPTITTPPTTTTTPAVTELPTVVTPEPYVQGNPPEITQAPESNAPLGNQKNTQVPEDNTPLGNLPEITPLPKDSVTLGNKNNPKTGDASNLPLHIVLMMASMLALTALLIKRRMNGLNGK